MENSDKQHTSQGVETIGGDQGVVGNLVHGETEETRQQSRWGLSTLVLGSATGSQKLRREQVPEQERVASIEDLRAVLVVEEGQVVGNLADDGVSDELANLRSSHSDLAELAGVGTTLGRLDKTLEDTRVGDGRERH
jgi:hypothetical protein